MKRESTVEEYLVKRANANGGEVRKVKWQGRDGAPDRVVMLPGGVVLWVELKAEGLAPLFPHTPHERKQNREHIRMREVGQKVFVIDSYSGVDALFVI